MDLQLLKQACGIIKIGIMIDDLNDPRYATQESILAHYPDDWQAAARHAANLFNTDKQLTDASFNAADSVKRTTKDLNDAYNNPEKTFNRYKQFEMRDWQDECNNLRELNKTRKNPVPLPPRPSNETLRRGYNEDIQNMEDQLLQDQENMNNGWQNSIRENDP